MTMTVYDVAVPALLRGLSNLRHILQKGEELAEKKGIKADELMPLRVTEDMFPLVRQVQIACDVTKAGVARLAGVDVPSHPDTEARYDDLYARIEKVEAFVKSLDKQAFDGAEERDVRFRIKDTEYAFKGREYLMHYVIPNLHFHVSTTYGLLRREGAELGKADYLGRF